MRYPSRQPNYSDPTARTHSDDLPCTVCGKPGPKYPRHRVCKACHIAEVGIQALKRKYGLTPEDLLVLLEKQNGQCAICEADITEDPHVDHDHRSKRVRGLLCKQCNVALGVFGDNVEGLMKAVAYLQRGSGAN